MNAWQKQLSADSHELLHVLLRWAIEKDMKVNYTVQVATQACAQFVVQALSTYDEGTYDEHLEGVIDDMVLTLRREVGHYLPDRVSQGFKEQTERMVREAKAKVQ